MSSKGGLCPHRGDGSQLRISHQEPSKQDGAEAPPPAPVTTAAHIILYLGDIHVEIQGLVFKSLHLHKLTLKNTSMHRLGIKKITTTLFVQGGFKTSSTRTNHPNHNEV